MGRNNLTAIVNVKGSEIATYHIKSDENLFETIYESDHIFRYKTRNTIRKGVMKLSKRLSQKVMEGYIRSYILNIEGVLDKNLWDYLPDGRLIPPVDADCLFYRRDDIKKFVEKMDHILKEKLKEADEMLLKNLDEAVLGLEKAIRVYRKNEPEEDWWWHLDKVKSGKIKVVWDEKKEEYIANS